jgi:hypothetical protein
MPFTIVNNFILFPTLVPCVYIVFVEKISRMLHFLTWLVLHSESVLLVPVDLIIWLQCEQGNRTFSVSGSCEENTTPRQLRMTLRSKARTDLTLAHPCGLVRMPQWFITAVMVA